MNSLYCVSGLLPLLGLLLAIAGLFQKNVKKLFPIIGLILSGLLLCAAVIVGLFFIAMGTN